MALAIGPVVGTGAASLAFAHEAANVAQSEEAGGQSGWLALTAFALLGLMLFPRLWVLRHRIASATHHTRRPLLGVALVFALLWMLPWLSLHHTHHLFDGRSLEAVDTADAACPVAQIAHTQAGGVLPSVAALAPLLAAEAIALPDPGAMPSAVTPEPAARGPPA